jgi:hypothetical protein
MILFISLTEEEQHIADRYAKLHSMSLEEAFKAALFEKIEDEYDAAAAEEAYQAHINAGEKSRPFSDLKKEMGL